MKLSSAKIKPKNILFTILYWVIAIQFYMFVRSAGLEDEVSTAVFGKKISLSKLFPFAFFAGLLTGIITSIIEYLVIPFILQRKKSFSVLLTVKILFYISTFTSVGFLFRLFGSVFFFDQQSFTQAFHESLLFLASPFFSTGLVCFSLFSFIYHFYTQINQKFGPGVLWNIIRGKYYQPQEEERIFMFLDLKSSTTIAEKLGHIRYSQLIQDCFYDISTSVIRFKAHVYQYVGDEVVLTWDISSGLHHLNCIRLFFDYENILNQKAETYKKKYGLVPQFKAGINMGKVTVAEVGDVKSEIAYHGDVLNTAARIQSQCNTYQKKILVSENFLQAIENQSFDLNKGLVGNIELRGKKEHMNVYFIDQIS